NQYKFVPAVASSHVDLAAVEAEDFGEANEGAAAYQMAVRVVDFLQSVHVEQQDRKGIARAVVALDFGVKGFDQMAIVGEAGERVAGGKVADVFFGVTVFSGFGGKNHGSECGDSHEGLQQEKGSVLRDARKGTVAVNGAPGGDDRERRDGG